MPVIWLVWSNLLFLFCIMSYVWRAHIPKRLDDRASLAVRLAHTMILALGINYGILILWTFSRYGEAMDKAWKRRIDGWLEERAAISFVPLQSSPEAMRVPHVDQEGFPATGGRDLGVFRPHFSSDRVGQQEYRPPSYVDIDYKTTPYDIKRTYEPIDPPIDSRQGYTYGTRGLSSTDGTLNLASRMGSRQMKPEWRSTALSPPSLSTITDAPHMSDFPWEQSANSSAGSSSAHADDDTTQDSNRHSVTPLGFEDGSG
jgi:hypothetical protein